MKINCCIKGYNKNWDSRYDKATIFVYLIIT